jgi:hypothetical protein
MWTLPQTNKEWRPVRKDGPLHWCERVAEQGRYVWKAICGMWAREGYEKYDDPVHGRDTLRCRECKKKAAG